MRSLGGCGSSRKSNEIFWTLFWIAMSYAGTVFIVVTSYRSPTSIYYKLIGSKGILDFLSLYLLYRNQNVANPTLLSSPSSSCFNGNPSLKDLAYHVCLMLGHVHSLADRA